MMIRPPRLLPWPLVFQLLAVVAGVWLVVQTWRLWVLVFVALILASAMLPVARWAERCYVPRSVWSLRLRLFL